MYLVSSAVFIKSVNYIVTIMKYNSNHDMSFCHDYHGPTKVFILLYIGCHFSGSQMFKYCIILLFHDRNMAISSIKDTK